MSRKIIGRWSLGVAVLAILLPATGFAQLRAFDPLRAIGFHADQPSIVKDLPSSAQDIVAEDFVSAIRSRYEYYLGASAEQPLTCKNAFAKATGLRLQGNYFACVDYANRCSQWKKISNRKRQLVRVAGAECLRSAHRYEEAKTQLDIAISNSRGSLKRYAAIRLVDLALNSIYPDRAFEILRETNAFRKADNDYIYRLAALYAEKNVKAVEVRQAERLSAKYVGSDPLLKEQFLIYTQFTEAWGEYNFSKALTRLYKNRNKMMLPYAWVSNLFFNFYIGKQSDKDAENIVLAAMPYFAGDKFPMGGSSNPYTYTELYQSRCASNLSQGELAGRLQKIKTGFMSGNLDILTTRRAVEKLNLQNPGKADIQTFLAYLNVYEGRLTIAKKQFWQALQVCPFYNRASWGLLNVNRTVKRRLRPDYQSKIDAINKAAKKVKMPIEWETYIAGYAGLTSEIKTALRFSLSFLKDYIPTIANAGGRFYVLQGFELLSESPGREDYRDKYVYSGKWKRLWDDVRGIGGVQIATGAENLIHEQFGGFNTGLHELAHQVQAVMPKDQDACVKRLYSNAKSRNVFSSPYYGLNNQEYFAGIIDLYSVETEESGRLSREWLRVNDPEAYQYAEEILKKAPRFKDFVCPL